MNGIGGNTTINIQIRTTIKNEIGERKPDWKTIQSLNGWLDLMSGDSKRTSFYSKIEESSHIFVSDYVPLDEQIKEENSRALINGKTYDILLIDDPMELHKQLEIYLKYTGGQNGSN